MEPAVAASIIQESWPHTLNVAVHVCAATAALLIGLLQLVRPKGDVRHGRYGRWFLRAIWIAVATAAVGVLVFRFRAFLGVITLLVAYWSFSGIRALRTRASGPTAVDAAGAALALAACVAFVIALRIVALPWSPAVIYSTLGTLFAVAAYDLIRFLFPRRWFGQIGLYEHLVKMIGAFSAALSAFAGTVLVEWQPYSQLAPSLICTVLMIGFVVRYRTGGLTSDL